MMSAKSKSIGPPLVAGTLTAITTVVLRRMEDEYTDQDTFTTGTVAAMYGIYGLHTTALAWATVKRIGPIPLPPRLARTGGVALAMGGAGVVVAGARPFGAGKQLSGVEPGSLHSTGIYHYSRNPQYVGLGLTATGAAVAARSAFATLLATGVWLAFRRWIPNEESHLTRIFGQQYLSYKAAAPRWLGKPRKQRQRSG